jgi:hypothetical protein
LNKREAWEVSRMRGDRCRMGIGTGDGWLVISPRAWRAKEPIVQILGLTLLNLVPMYKPCSNSEPLLGVWKTDPEKRSWVQKANWGDDPIKSTARRS